MVVSTVTQVAMEESKEKAPELDTGFFSEELRRMEQYDGEVCLERWKSSIQDIRANGLDNVRIAQKFGEREWEYPLDALEAIINLRKAYALAESKTPKGTGLHLEAPLWSKLDRKGIERLRKKNEITLTDSHSREQIAFRLDDEVGGCEFCFGVMNPGDRSSLFRSPHSHLRDCYVFSLYGATRVDGKTGPLESRKLGKIDLSELASIGERRFAYIFGVPPATNVEITNALIALNKFPSITPDGSSRIEYKLEERTLEQTNPPRGVCLMYENAREAQEQGLFSGVRVYELVGKKVPIPQDPVLVGVDHFGNRMPLIYWAGDVGLVEKEQD